MKTIFRELFWLIQKLVYFIEDLYHQSQSSYLDLTTERKQMIERGD